MNNIKTLLIFTCLLNSTLISHAQSLQWASFVDSIGTFSSPRSAELTGDSVKDIVIGGGVDSISSNYGVMAFDGANGNLLWTVTTRDEIFASAVFNDITGDTIPDVFIGGRSAEFMAIDGSNGNVIWEFFPQGDSIDPADSGWYNFYSAQVIIDVDSDGVYDLLVANGGDHKAQPWDTMRPPGYLMVLSGLTGATLALAVVPDSQETYCSPLFVDLKNMGSFSIIFGTGGETNRGSLWHADFFSLLGNDLSPSLQLVSDPGKGFIAPPSIVDLNDDGVKDIVAQGFNGTVYAINGDNANLMWSVNIPGSESSTEPIIGNFTGSFTPDVFAITYKGSAPSYVDFYQVLIDGETGQIAWMDSLSDLHFASANAFDYNEDNRDDVLVSVNNFTGTHFEHQLKIIDFKNDTIIDLYGPEAGVGLASTPLIEDGNGTGTIDITYSIRADSTNPVGTEGIHVKQLSTSVKPGCGIAWGSYMGNNFDGHYYDKTSGCGSIVMNYLSSNPSCNGLTDGYLVMVPSGGTAPYTYYWEDGSMNDSLTDLGPGTYSVTVVDATCCRKSNTYTLSDPYTISFGGIYNNPCQGDSVGLASVSSTGCPCMFSGCVFDWSNGDTTKNATNLPAGTHYITITHTDSCIVTDSVVITEGGPLIDSFYVDTILCPEDYGAITLYPSDSANTIYDWSNGETSSMIDSLTAGTYSVNIMDIRPCYDTIDFTINPGPDTIQTTITSTDISCFGYADGSATVVATGGHGLFGYSWSPDGTNPLVNVPAGTYTVVITDILGCTATDSVTISEPSQLVISSIISTDTDQGICTGTVSYSISGGTPQYSVSYSPSLDTANACAGSYEITVTDSNGCIAADSVTVGVKVSVKEKDILSYIRVSPNPATDNFTVYVQNIVAQNYEVLIYNISGQLMKRYDNISGNQLEIEGNYLEPGLYQLFIRGAETTYSVRVLLIE